LEREEEISKVKSEMVRLRSTYNDTIYTNKKRIEQLESENLEYAAKQKEMELELVELQKSLDSLVPTSGSSVASF
jgi:chromosome segregation ATPase